MRPTVLKRENIALQDKIAAFQEIFALLEDMPQAAARDIIQQLQNGSDPVVLLASIQGRQLGTLPSAQATVRAMLPPIQSDCEFELLIRHPNAFPALNLTQYAQRTGNTLAGPGDAWTWNSSSSNISSIETSSKSNLEPDFLIGASNDCTRSDKGSSHVAPQYFDPRLNDLEIGFWTTVSITNIEAAGAISSYLEVQHHVCGVFDAQLFIRDLVQFSFEFCSPFMVS